MRDVFARLERKLRKLFIKSIFLLSQFEFFIFQQFLSASMFEKDKEKWAWGEDELGNFSANEDVSRRFVVFCLLHFNLENILEIFISLSRKVWFQIDIMKRNIIYLIFQIWVESLGLAWVEWDGCWNVCSWFCKNSK